MSIFRAILIVRQKDGVKICLLSARLLAGQSRDRLLCALGARCHRALMLVSTFQQMAAATTSILGCKLMLLPRLWLGLLTLWAAQLTLAASPVQ